MKTKMIDEETNKIENEKEFLNDNICISVLFWIFLHWPLDNPTYWWYNRYASMLIKVMLCFSIRLEDTSSVEVLILMHRHVFFYKNTTEMKTIMIR